MINRDYFEDLSYKYIQELKDHSLAGKKDVKTFRYLDFRNINFINLDLRFAAFHECDFRDCDLTRVNLKNVSMTFCVLDYANLQGAMMQDSNLTSSYFNNANLNNARLFGANLSDAKFKDANLVDADLASATLRHTDLSGAIGLQSSAEWMKQFETDRLGWIVYKRIGSGLTATSYLSPKSWIIAPGSFITENANPDRTLSCACGVNFGTLNWCSDHYDNSKLWKCRIRYEDGPGIVVPYCSAGKARCERLELLEIIN